MDPSLSRCVEPSLIIGVDPGTTLSYCAMDLNGKLLMVRSSKTERFNEMLFELVQLGTPVAVGTDKASAPAIPNKLAIKTGARLITPERDLKVEQKRELSSGSPAKNNHELDAIAACTYAFGTMRQLIEKTKKHGQDMGANQRSWFERLVLRDEFSIDEAREIVTTHKLNASDRATQPESEPAFARKLRALRHENAVLREQTEHYSKQLRGLERQLAEARRSKKPVHVRADTALLRELESLLRGIKSDERIITKYATREQYNARKNPFRLDERIMAVGTSLIIQTETGNRQIPLSSARTLETGHLCVINMREIAAYLQTIPPIERIVEDYRREKAHARRSI